MKAKKLPVVIMALLWLQFLLGMLANLYSKIPENKPFEVFHQFGYILFHALNGTVLLVLAVVYLVQTIRRGGDRRPAIGGLSSIILAYAAGEIFVATQNDIWSLIMALAFLGAFMNYGRILMSQTKPTK